MTSISPALVSQIYNRSGASGSTGVSSAPAGHESSAADTPVGFVDDIRRLLIIAAYQAVTELFSPRPG